MSSVMFDFTQELAAVWPERLAPVGEGTFDKEPFGDWWQRNYDELKHLQPELCEQWVYRHWKNSSFTFIPLDSLRCEELKMSTDEVLQRVHRELAGPLSPEFDRRVFEEPPLGGLHPTAQAFAELGTWDYPIVTLRTPNGFAGYTVQKHDIELVLVEGHQRHRYLSALQHFGDSPAGPHRVFAVSSPVVT